MPDNVIKEPMEYTSRLRQHYEGMKVKAIISLQIKGDQGDEIAMMLSREENVTDVFLVTGDVDIIVKADFDRPENLMNFILQKVSKLDGVLDTTTMMILTSYKERGRIVIEEDKV